MTTFNYDTNGKLISITAPNGKVTTVTLNANGYLASVTNPKSETYQMAYKDAGGLLTSFQKPNGLVSTFTYDSTGNLLTDVNSIGNSTTLSQSSGNVISTSALNLQTTFSISNNSGEVIQTQTDPDLSTTSSMYQFSAGLILNQQTTNPYEYAAPQYTSDLRFPNQARTLSFLNVQKGDGTYYDNYATSVNLTDPSNPFSIDQLTTTITHNDGSTSPAYTINYAGSTKTQTTTSQLGRTQVSILDSYQRPISIQNGSLLPTLFTYTDDHLTQVSRSGTRITNFSYDPTSSLLSSVTNPLSQTTSFVYDSAERLSSQVLPDLRVIQYSYDSDGNMTSITPPGRSAHDIGFLSNGLMSSYQAPSVSGVLNTTTQYVYDLDKRLTEIQNPDGQLLDFGYDPTAGTLLTTTGNFGTLTNTYSYGGKFPTNMSMSNGLNAYTGLNYGVLSAYQLNDGSASVVNYSESYGNLYPGHPVSETISSNAYNNQTINFTYDADQLLSQAGDITLTFNSNSELQGTTLGIITDAYTYNTYGEVTGYSASVSGAQVYGYTLTRDDLGRITQKVENLNGTSSTYVYSYDSAGRLTAVTKNGSAYSSYSYDTNSNRTGGTINGVTTSASYDNQDRIISYNTDNYTFGNAGDLQQKVSSVTGQTTGYQYDILGNLSQWTTTSQTIAYRIDPFFRRFEKQVNGTVTERYVYKPDGRLTAILDPSNNFVQIFVYGSKSNVPDYFYDDVGDEYRIISDNLGSPRLVLKVSDGSISQIMNHDEFGRVTQDTNVGFQPFGFAGGLYDSDTGLVRFGSRDYDPESGRWTSKDPILFGTSATTQLYASLMSGRKPSVDTNLNGYSGTVGNGAPADTNLYGYSFNDPVNFIDPKGTTPYFLCVISKTYECIQTKEDARSCDPNNNDGMSGRASGALDCEVRAADHCSGAMYGIGGTQSHGPVGPGI